MLNPAEEAALQENTISKTDDMTEVVPLGDIKYEPGNQEKEPSTPPGPEAEPNKGPALKKADEGNPKSNPSTQHSKHETSPRKPSYESLLSAIDNIKSQLDDLKSRLNRVECLP